MPGGRRKKMYGEGMSFTSGQHWGYGITPLNISPRQRLDDVVEATSDLPFGGTDRTWSSRATCGRL